MPYGKYLHVGGDEVSQIGSDERCKATGKTPFELQLEWLNKVCDFAVANGRTPIFWDDMPFKFAGLWYPINFDLSDEETRRLMDFTMVDEVIDRFPKECVYMRWFYGDATLLGNQLVLDWYAKSGLKVMAATAASEGTCVLIQTPDGRLPYIKGFSEITAERKTFEGIFATAWDDTSAHLKTVERSYIAQGEFGWNPTGRTVEEFKTAHARREFGLTRPDMEFITDMEAMRPFYDAALVTAGHRNPASPWRSSRSSTCPIRHAPGSVERDFCRTPRFGKGVHAVVRTRLRNARTRRKRALRNRYTLEIYDCTNDMLYFPARVFLALEKYDKASGAAREQALAELSDLCGYFYDLRRDVLDSYSKTRFMSNAEGFVAGNSHHRHLASRTNNGDWVFWFELPMVRKIEAWVAEQRK